MHRLTTRKFWETPKLIILERGRPEERVLAGCKMPGSSATKKAKKAAVSDSPPVRTVQCPIHLLNVQESLYRAERPAGN